MTVAKRMDPQKSEEARECYELSLAGYSQRQIADKMGHSQSWVRDRLKLHTENRVHPKADEYRAQQIDRARIYIRSLWSQVLAGDPKAIAQAIRTEERISKLLGLDSATQFVLKQEKTDDVSEVQRIMDHFFGTQPGEPSTKTIPGEVVSPTTGRRRRPLLESPAITYAAPQHNPDTEFATDNAFQPHEVHKEAVEFADDLEEFEPVKADPQNFKRTRRPANPASRFLVDDDD